jgi:hypothetical protein
MKSISPAVRTRLCTDDASQASAPAAWGSAAVPDFAADSGAASAGGDGDEVAAIDGAAGVFPTAGTSPEFPAAAGGVVPPAGGAPRSSPAAAAVVGPGA